MHAGQSAKVVASPTSGPRVWSYEALRRAHIWLPVRDDREMPDGSRIGTVALAHYSPEHGDGRLGIRGPDRNALGRWLFALPATFNTWFDARPRRAEQVERVRLAFARVDWGRELARDPRVGRISRARGAELAATEFLILEAFARVGLQ